MKGVVSILVVLLAAWMAGAEYVWLCKVKNHCGETPLAVRPEVSTGAGAAAADPTPRSAAADPRPRSAPAPAPSDPAPAPQVADRSGSEPQPAGRTAPQATSTVIYINGEAAHTSRPFGFDPDQWQISSTADGAQFVRQLADFLAGRPALDVTLNGQYFAFESRPPDAENLGQARAAALKAALVSSGVAADRLATGSSLLQDSGRKAGFDIAAVDYSELIDTRYVYFQSAAVSADLSPEVERYARNLGRFLERHRGASVRVIGHTDNTGESETNETLGLSRARHVAELLSSVGLPATRLRIGSRGQQEPVGDNNTEAGRSANRRVEIQLDWGRR